MPKVNMSELAEMLSARTKLSKREAQQFLVAIVETIQEGIINDKMVKIKGLGTFKVVDIDARESVNVNTGERVIIDGHQKLSFTPDNSMKELVNKPFSQFETVILNEGVQFDDMEKEDRITEEESDKDIITEEQTEEESDKDIILEEQTEEQSDKNIITEEQTEEQPEGELEEEPDEEPDEPGQTVLNRGNYWWAWLLLALAACVISFAGGYLMGSKIDSRAVDEANEQTDTLVVAAPVVNKPIVDTINIDTMNVEASVVKEPAAKAPAVKEPEPGWKKYEAMDGRVRTGAYYIVGDDYTIQARSGDSMKRIAKRTLGEGMECYIEVYNNLTAASPLKEGQNIKIPKLQLKKKLKKNINK